VRRTDWQRARLQKFLQAANGRIHAAYQDIDSTMAGEMKGMAKTTVDAIQQAINDMLQAKILQEPRWTDQQLQAIAGDTLINGAPSAEWWSRQADDFSQALADTLRQGLLRGETVVQMRDRIVPKVDLRRVKSGDRSIVVTARRNAEALVRTTAITVANEAHMQAYKANSAVIAKVQWMATLDPRTCESCGVLDGKAWALDESHPNPALHWGCRCCLVPVLKSWEQLAKEFGGDPEKAKILDDIPRSTRASMDGQVASTMTYQDWFAEQSEDRQREILGPGRFALYKKDGLSLTQMVDGRGNPLTLKQLRAR
jgi:SPP1 gp7 family putative phage head morphogenesis protein